VCSLIIVCTLLTKLARQWFDHFHFQLHHTLPVVNQQLKQMAISINMQQIAE
jgi:hypothetical protein